MPLINLATSSIDETTAQQVVDHLHAAIALLHKFSQGLTPAERKKYAGGITSLMIEKVKDYRIVDESMCSPDIDWQAFEEQYDASRHYHKIEKLLHVLLELSSDKRILHEHFLYRVSLAEYRYTKYREKSTDNGSFTTKSQQLQQFFPRTGKPDTKQKD